MKMLSNLIIALLLTFAIPSAAQDARWLCIGDMSTGFNMEGGTWMPRTYRADLQKFLVAKHGKEIAVKEIGKAFDLCRGVFGKNGDATCVHDLGSAKKVDADFSFGIVAVFVFNTKSLRFVYQFTGGYALNARDSVYSIIGRCTAL